MAWESLAAGAVLLAGRTSGVERTPAQIAQFAKSSRERVCAAARKIRLQTPVDAPVVRDCAVDRVVTALDETGIDVETGIELVRVGERLLDVADTVPIGPGTARMTVAGAAVWVVNRLTAEKALTQAGVVAAVSETVPTSKSKIASYFRAVYKANENHLTQTDPVAELVASDYRGLSRCFRPLPRDPTAPPSAPCSLRCARSHDLTVRCYGRHVRVQVMVGPVLDGSLIGMPMARTVYQKTRKLRRLNTTKRPMTNSSRTDP
jgi:transcription initiation factor TFIIB